MNQIEHDYERSTENEFIRSATTMPLKFAPEGIQEALDAYRIAQAEFEEASRIAQNSPDAVEEAKVRFDQDLRAAVKANKPSPSKDLVERAEVRAQLDLEAVTPFAARANAAKYRVLVFVRDPKFREVWRDNCATEAEKMRPQLQELSEQIAPLVGAYETLIGVTKFLGDFPQNNHIARSNGSSARNYFQDLIALQPWALPAPPAPRTIKGVNGMAYYDAQTGERIMSTTS
jgi:hypothetical protein